MKQKKQMFRLHALLLSFAILMGCMTLIPVAAVTAAEEWGDPNGDGVWEIDSVDDLYAFAGLCADNSKGLDYFAGKTVRLMCDLDLNPGWNASSKKAPENGSTWVPANTFKGVFDGQGYTISGLYLNGNGNQALIWKGNGCTVRNLQINNSYIYSGNHFNAGVVASVTGAKCTFEHIRSDVIIETLTTEYRHSTGGICGVLYGAAADFTDCVFTGSLKSGGMVGGILGCTNEYQATLKHCVNYGTLETVRNTANTAGHVEAGGMIGRISSDVELISCANFGSIKSGNSQWDGALAYLDRLTITKTLNDSTMPSTVATVYAADCYTYSGETFTQGFGMHGSRNRFDVTVSYTNGKTTALTYAAGNSTYANVRALIQQTASVTELFSKPGYTDLQELQPVTVDEGNVICIASADDLFAFAKYAKIYNYYAGRTAVLTADIDLNPSWDASTKTAPAQVWVPIAELRGTLDGNGHSVSGLYVNQSASGSALIVRANGGTIRNLRMLNSYILSTSKDYVASFCCSASNGAVLDGLYSNAIVEGRKADGTYVNYVGGILGGLYNASATVSNSVFAGTVIGAQGVAGLVGTLNSNQSSLVMTDCANYGEIKSSSNHNGGLIGVCRGNAELTRCVNAGAVQGTDNFSGALMFLECNTAKAELTLEDCYYLRGTRPHSITAWHNWYQLEITYGGTVTGSVNAEKNSQAWTDHTALTRSLTSANELLELSEFLGWGAMGDLVIPVKVLSMLCRIPVQTGYVQEPTVPLKESASLRVIGLVNLSAEELQNYEKLGFMIRVIREDGKAATGSVSGTSVYSSIRADVNGNLTEYTAQELNAQYICALTLKNIPAVGTYKIELRSFITDANGVTTVDCGCVLTVTDGQLVK